MNKKELEERWNELTKSIQEQGIITREDIDNLRAEESFKAGQKSEKKALLKGLDNGYEIGSENQKILCKKKIDQAIKSERERIFKFLRENFNVVFRNKNKNTTEVRELIQTNLDIWEEELKNKNRREKILKQYLFQCGYV